MEKICSHPKYPCSHLKSPVCHSAAAAPLRTSKDQDRSNWDPCFSKDLAPGDKEIFISCSRYGDDESIKEFRLHGGEAGMRMYPQDNSV